MGAGVFSGLVAAAGEPDLLLWVIMLLSSGPGFWLCAGDAQAVIHRHFVTDTVGQEGLPQVCRAHCVNARPHARKQHYKGRPPL